MSPKQLSQSDVLAKNSLYLESPWRWLYEVTIPTDPLSKLRLAQDRTSVIFGSSSSGLANTFYPASIGHSVMQIDTEATLPTITMTVTNISREVQALLETYNGLIGENVTIMLVNLIDVGGGSSVPSFSDEFSILDVTANEKVIDVRLGQFNPFELSFPNTRYTRDHCGLQYKGALCGYEGAEPSCDKSLNGSNGCEFHDNSERFGGEPGIPRISGSSF